MIPSSYIFEFVGTAILILIGNGSVANIVLKETKGNAGGTFMCIFGWGCGVMMAVAVSNNYSGAHLNPAVSLALALTAKMSWIDFAGYVVAQFMGAMFGTTVSYLYFKSHYQITENKTDILSTFCTVPAIRKFSQNFLSEFVCGFVLVLVVLFTTGPVVSGAGEKITLGLGAIGALPTALLVVGIGLSLGGTTGFAMNPARDLGPRIMHALLPVPNKGKSDWSYSWIPVVGPMLGAAAASLIFLWIR